jgi:hypothetical protein
VRVHPFTGLVIDVDTWATAHDYHRRHQELHLLTLHGSGIAYGLDVLPTDPPSETVVVEPGVAIDPLGNVIIVPERQHIALSERASLGYLALDYVESIPPAGGSQKDTRARVLEDFRLRSLSTLPEAPALELARVQLAPEPAAIVVAANPWSPGCNEIDSRYRLRLRVQAPRDLTIGLVLHQLEELSPNHLAGFQFFARELESAGIRPKVIAAGDGAVPDADLIYVSGSGETEIPALLAKRLAEQNVRGSWLFADACGTGVGMVQSLVKALKTSSESAVHAEQLVLGCHHVFGAAPAGAFPTREIIWGERSILSPRDYGCAWSGRRGEQVFQRDVIRSALEFGVNVAFGALHKVAAR